MLCDHCTEPPVYTIELKGATTLYFCEAHVPEYLQGKVQRGQLPVVHTPPVIKKPRKPRTSKNAKAVAPIPEEAVVSE